MHKTFISILLNYLPIWFCSLCLCLSTSLSAQNFAIPIGNAADDEGGTTLTKGPSGDYYIAGFSNDDAMVCRVTAEGTIIWSKSIDLGPEPDYILHLDLTSDNFLIGCGNPRTLAGDNPNGFVFKMDLSGTLIWSRTYVCDDNYLWSNGLAEASNGNYRVIGSYTNVRLNNYLIEFDNTTGAQVWDTIYARSNISNSWDESFYDIITHDSNDANYIGGRFQKVGGYGTYRPSLTKINPDGSLAWSKTYLYNDGSGGGRYYCFSVDQDGDSLVMGLFCKDGGTGAPFETGIIKTDLDGNIGWAKLYESPGNDLRTYNMESVPDGYLIAGWIETGDESLYMIKTDKSGTLVWAKSYGGSGTEDTYLMSSNSRVIVDGDFAVTVGRTNSFGGSEDIFLVKADLANGELVEGSCFDDLTIIETNLPAFQADYFLTTERLPIEVSDPVVPVSDLIFEGAGELLDEIADTIVGGDTIRLCNGDEVTLFADWSPSFDFLWSTGGTSQSETVSVTGTYWVEVSGDGCIIWSDTAYVAVDSLIIDLGNDTAICDMDTYLLDASFVDDATYLWNDGSTDQTLLANASGWYWVTVETEICSFTDSIELVFENLDLYLGPDTTICSGESVLLDAYNPGAVFEWSDGSTDQTLNVTLSGDYWVIVSSGGCITTDTISITVIDVSVDLGDDLILCTGETVLLDAGFIVDANYLWNDGSTDQTLLVSTDGSYSVMVSNGSCTASDEIDVSFFEPIADFDGNPRSGCVALNVDFTDLSTTPFGIIDSWMWTFGDGGTSTSANPNYTFTSPGSYDVSLTIGTNLGCSDDVYIADYINVSENATANFTYSPDNIAANDLIIFTNLSSNATSWFWDFGDGATSSAEHPEHIYETTGEYMVTLTAMNDEGCNGTVSYLLIVRDAVYIFVPNTFTPDGDNFNETWKPSIYGIDIYDYHMLLFNRWGEVIWESFDVNIGWDGTYGSGDLVQDGVYLWVMQYGDRWTDEQFKLEGHITILK